MTVPAWRKGAVYHRALTDEDGMVTGREVCVYETLFGGGRVCEGVLGGKTYEQEWRFDRLADALNAADDWTGNGELQGNWSTYHPATRAVQLWQLEAEAQQRLGEQAKETSRSLRGHQAALRDIAKLAGPEHAKVASRHDNPDEYGFNRG